jgi:alpha-glucosidase (family GH31 glycosyl hydrolase)
MYTCLFEVSQWGGSCIDPLFYYYPLDDNLFTNVEQTFMVGGALKVSPILEAGVTDTFTSYFPAGVWVNMADFSEIIDTTLGGSNVTLQARNTVNAHLAPGAMVAIQNNTDQDFQSTNDLVYRAPISLVFNRDPTGYAAGTVLLDNGTSRAEISNWQYEYYNFQYSSKSINKFFSQGNTNTQNYDLLHLIILNAADLNTTDFACYMDANFTAVNMTYLYDETKQALYLF